MCISVLFCHPCWSPEPLGHMLYLSFVPLGLTLKNNIIVSGRGIIQTADIFMMVAVSTERYKAICQPLVPRQPYYMYRIFVAATSIGLEFPRFFEFKLNDNHTDYDTTNLVRFLATQSLVDRALRFFTRHSLGSALTVRYLLKAPTMSGNSSPVHIFRQLVP